MAEMTPVRSSNVAAVGYEDGTLETPLRFVQRIAAVREADLGVSASAGPPRYPL